MELVPFKFQEVRLRESCWINEKPYFSGRAIGEWLEVKHPNRYVHKIVDRNPHILQFATFVKLTNVEGSREISRDIQAYDPIGLQLIINKSNQPKAIQFQIAVAHLVAAYMRGELTFKGVKRIIEPPTLDGLADVAPYVRGKGQAINKLCMELQRSPNTIRKYIRNIREGKPPYRERVKEAGTPGCIHTKYRNKYDETARLYNEGIKIKDISRISGIPDKTLYRWFRYAH